MNRTKFPTVEIDLESSTGEKRVHRDRRKRRASLGDRRRIRVIDRGARRIKGKRAFLGHFGTFFDKGHKHKNFKGLSQLPFFMFEISIGPL